MPHSRLARRIFSLSLLLLWVAFAAGAEARPPRAAVVMDAATGRVLYGEGSERRIHPASMTKMMTLYLLFEALEKGRLSLDTRLRVSKRAASMPPSRLGLRPGQRMRVRDAILALVTKSANDVAVVVAEALAGSEAAFARRMTRKARALGMRRTVFRNASGLHHPAQRTTVRDMAILARALLRDFPSYYRYFSRRSFTWAGRRYRNHNRLLGRYRGLDGVKTGYVRASGYNLAASAVRNGRRVIVVVAGGRTARERDRKVVRLLDLGFRRLEKLRLVAVAPPRPRPARGAERASLVSLGAGAVRFPLPAVKPQLVAWRAAEFAGWNRAAAMRRGRTARDRARYGVQVGAYLRPDRAYAAAAETVRLLPALLLAGEIDVSPRQGRRRTFYRARIVGFERGTARAICRALERRGRDCLVVAYGRPVAVAAR